MSDFNASDPADFWVSLGISVRTARALSVAGVHSVEQVKEKTELELLRIPNIGRTALRELKDALGAGKPAISPPVNGIELVSTEAMIVEIRRRGWSVEIKM